jgi:hypothetical protein
VLLRLPLDLLGELGGRHHGDGDLSDDHRLTGDAHGDIALLDFAVLKETRECFHHRTAVHDVPIDDGLRGQRRIAESHELEPLATVAQLTDFDRARTDVDPDEITSFGHSV